MQKSTGANLFKAVTYIMNHCTGYEISSAQENYSDVTGDYVCPKVDLKYFRAIKKFP